MDRNTPLFDTSLSDRERAEYLVSRMTLEEKFACFGLQIRNDRLGLDVSTCGGEGAHGVQARAGQGGTLSADADHFLHAAHRNGGEL